MAKLTEKQRQFVKEYLVDLNATQAAIRAGYSPKTANEQATRLLVNVSIRTAIEKAMQKRSERTEITADMVLQEFWSIAKDDIKNHLAYRTEKTLIDYEDGKPIFGYKTIVDMKDSNEVDTKNVSEFSCDKDGKIRFKLYCRDNALLQVGKHLGMFVEKSKVELTGKDGGPLKIEKGIDFESLTDEELELLERILPERGDEGTS